MDERIRQLLGSSRNKLATNVDFNLNLNLERNTRNLENGEINNIINLNDVFEEERIKSTCYRILGKVNVLTSNVLSPNATDSDWDVLFDGTPPVTPNNWLFQITYPSEMDDTFIISGNTTSNQANKGIQILSINQTNPTGSRDQLSISSLQNHNLSEGDYIYIYNNIITNPIYHGFHLVESLGVLGNEIDNSCVLQTSFISADTINNFKRVVNISQNDILFTNPMQSNFITVSDLTGGTLSNEYTIIHTTQPHNLLEGDYVDIRNNIITNGLHRVEFIIQNNKFVIKLESGTTPGTNIITNSNLRKLDGTPSDYYVRKFEVLTSNKYETYNCAYGNNIYPETIDKTLGISNKTWLFQFNEDINTKNLVNHRGGEVTEFFLTTIKRAGQNTYDWSKVNADWFFNRETTTTQNGVEIISNRIPTSIGSIEKISGRTESIISGDTIITKGSMYVGDFVEYNRLELREYIITDIIHRFASFYNENGEGYYYKPFHKIEIKKYSDLIETANITDNIEGIPGDAEYYSDGIVAWRDVLTVGFFEGGVNGIDYPFLNGCHYLYDNFNINVRRQTPPVKINQDNINFVNPTTIC